MFPWLRHVSAAAAALPPAVRIRRCLAASLIFMAGGHAAVMASGAVFDPRDGTGYDPAQRWVSDFAAKWPEGLLIKASIVCFCAALWQFFHGVIRRRCRRGWSAAKAAWVLAGTAMIGGLALVAVFDMSPAQYRYHESNWFFRLFGRGGRFEDLGRSPAEWAMRAHHQIGFRLFVAAFFATALTLALLEWRDGRRRRLPLTAGILLAAAAFAWWLLAGRAALPGIPQRALLVLMFAWLLRESRGLSAEAASATKID